MKTPLLFFMAATSLASLAVLALNPEPRHIEPRDALRESAPINGDVQGLLEELKTKASQQERDATGKALDVSATDKTASQCFNLKAFRIEEEYRFLYRGSITPPEKIFATGFLSYAEKGRNEDQQKASDANLKTLEQHAAGNYYEEADPYIATSKSGKIAAVYSRSPCFDKKHDCGWIYLIHTNKGIDFSKVTAKNGVPYSYHSEKEIAIPGRIQAEEIVGAWPWKEPAYDYSGSDSIPDYTFPMVEAFIKNPRYSGPLKIVGDICPPNL
jgi:hypothetical protein